MSPRVTMLVTNPVRRDNRVLKEARVLQNAGYDVTIVGTADAAYPNDEIVDGVRIRLVDDARGYRHQRAQSYLRRRNRLLAAYRHVYDSLLEAIPLENGFPQGVLSRVSRRAALLPFRTVHRIVQESMASAHRLGSALSWKFEPFVRLRDFTEAAFTIAGEIEADVWHAHDVDTMPTALALRRAFGGKVIYDAHEYWLDCNNAYTPFARAAWEVIERDVTAQADAVITVSRSIAKVLAEKYAVREPDVVLNSPSYERARPDGGLRSRLGVAPDRFLAAYVGLVTVGRGYEVLFEALRELPDVDLLVLGPGLESYKNELKALAVRLGVAARVHFMEPVPYREIQSITAACDAGLVVVQRDALSYELCLPSKFFEYLFSGIPVAVSDLPELRPIVNEYGAGVCFDERSPASVAEGIRRLQSERARYQGAAWERTVQRIAERYDWEHRKQDLLDVYARIGVLPEARV